MKRIIYTLTLLSLITGLLSAGPKESVKDLQRQQKELQKQMETTNKMLQQTKKSATATVNKLELLNQNIKTQRRIINTLDNEISALDREMNSLNEKKQTLQREQKSLREDYARLVRESHYAQMQQSPLLFLISSSSFQQLVRRIRYMQEFARQRREQVARIEGVQTEIEIQNNLLKENRSDKAAALKSKQREQDNLTRDQRKQKDMLNQLKKDEKDLTAKLKKQQKKADELSKKVDEMIRKQTQTKTTLTKEQQLIAGDFEKNKGRLPWPVEKGFISGQFGKHQHPVYDQVTIDNKGIYLQTTAGATARAVFEGEVSSCFMTGNTYAVIVLHGNYRSVYSNLSKLNVKQGQHVSAKQSIGTIYTDPDEDNKTELFFQIYKDRQLQNPSLWLAN